MLGARFTLERRLIRWEAISLRTIGLHDATLTLVSVVSFGESIVRWEPAALRPRGRPMARELQTLHVVCQAAL